MRRETFIWAVHRLTTLAVLLLAGHLLLAVFFWKTKGTVLHVMVWHRSWNRACNPHLEKQHRWKRTAGGLSGFKKSVQITAARRAVVSVASNLPHLWAGTNICVAKWQVRIWEPKNSLAKTNEKIYFSVFSVVHNIHRKSCANIKMECGNNWGEGQAFLFQWLCLLW